MSATARVTGHSRTTIARWLERAATAAACFNHRLLRDFDVIELQADELCTFIGSKRRTLWLFATIEVCSRLWAGSVLGRRSHRNTKAAINDVILRGRRVGCPLIATDGVEYYVGVIVRLLGSACVYGEIGILPLPATFADAHGLPSGDRIRGQPHGDIAALDQRSFVCRPIPDVVLCLVLWVHSRLHVEIMHLLSPR